jgi:hypothetical protein
VIQPYIGQYFSKQWVLQNVLQLNEEEVQIMQEQIEQEAEEEAEKQAEMQQQQGDQPQEDNPDDTSANTPSSGGPKQPDDINKKVAQLIKGTQ